MSRDITEIIDDHCREEFGHTHWAIISTLSDQEKVGLDSVAVIRTYEGVPVAFYVDDDRKREYTFEMSTTVTEQCKIVANSQEEAEAIMLSGDAEWEEVKSQGGDFDCIQEDIL